ncbi:HBL247Cp [Eremothecium sinecaudum]|uniref:HBL247Cp n=1 Tax=Eremothecium sinecaudum TaxID=45286 RepID=A0A125RDV0_9SACH|nr:HBL247Cp [Eremothecium sinecaudum]AMD18655.1 HBL247Cp [Eremothecium sinecaudum]
MRSLNPFEELYYHKRGCNLHSCFVVGVTLNKPVERSTVQQVLIEVIKKNPILYQNIFKSESDNRLVVKAVTGKIQLNDVYEVIDATSLDEATANWIFKSIRFSYHSQTFLWKILALNGGQQLLYCFDHSLLDGMSTVIFWTDFMSVLNSVSSLQDLRLQDAVVYNGDGNVVLPAHPYDVWPSSWRYKLVRAVLPFYNTYLKPYVPEAWTRVDMFNFSDYSFPKGLFDDANNKRSDSKRISYRIEPDKLQSLSKQCREHGVSVTSWLAAKIMEAILKVERNHTTGSKISISIPINSRTQIAEKMPNYPKEALRMGLFLTCAVLSYNIGSKETEIWALASIFQKQLREARYSESGVYTCKVLELLDVEEYVGSYKKQRYPSSTFEVTNLGLQDFKTTERDLYYVVDAVFIQPQGLSNILNVAVVSTPIGGLHASICIPRDIAEVVTIEEY